MNQFWNDRNRFPKLIETLCATHNFLHRLQGEDHTLMPSSGEWSAYRRGSLLSYIRSPVERQCDHELVPFPMPAVDRRASRKRELLAEHCLKVFRQRRGFDNTPWDADYRF